MGLLLSIQTETYSITIIEKRVRPVGEEKRLATRKCNMTKMVRFILTPEERQLVLKHGYPFEELEAVLNAAKDQNEPIDVEMEDFWFEQLLGDLARSINHASNSSLVIRLNELYEYLVREGKASGLNVY